MLLKTRLLYLDIYYKLAFLKPDLGLLRTIDLSRLFN